MHLSSKDDLYAELKANDERNFLEKVQQNSSNKGQKFIFDHRKIQMYEQSHIKANFSFLSSILLVAAFIAGHNKEFTD